MIDFNVVARLRLDLDFNKGTAVVAASLHMIVDLLVCGIPLIMLSCVAC